MNFWARWDKLPRMMRATIFYIVLLLIVSVIIIISSGCVTMSTPFGDAKVVGEGANISFSGYIPKGKSLSVKCDVENR